MSLTLQRNVVIHRHAWKLIRASLIVAASSLAFGISLGTAEVSVDNEREVKEQIAEDWRARRESVSSVDYYLEGTCTIPRGNISAFVGDLLPKSAPEVVPEMDYTFTCKRRVLLDFEHKRVRREERGEVFVCDQVIFRPNCEIFLSDGKSVQRFEPRGENTSEIYTPPKYQPELSLLHNADLKFLFDVTDEVILLAHGRPPKWGDQLDLPLSRLETPIRMDTFKIERAEDQDHEPCFVLRGERPQDKSTYEIWVAREQASSVVKFVRYAADRPIYTADVVNEKTNRGWFPSIITVTRYFNTGKVERIQRLAITKSIDEPAIADSDFHIEPTPGMILYDKASKRRLIYRGPNEPMIDVREAARNEENEPGSPPKK